MKRYAQIDAAGLCMAVSDLSGEVDAPHMIPVTGEPLAYLGKKWAANAWADVPAELPTEKQMAAAELQAIDAATGMSRTMREAFIALGVKVGADVAYLQQQETKAAAARLKLK